ncbi:MAG: hypothetical protein H7Y17_05230 [Chlorobia bacterium]|nr:hypothetical protein [Fimbriimonadaceae bacterium]
MRAYLLLTLAVFAPALGCSGGENPEQNLTNPTASAPPDPNAPPPTQKNVQFGSASKPGSIGSK